MPVLVGTPCMLLVSRVQVYQTCSMDLGWQRTVHTCQRCPKASLTTNALAPSLLNYQTPDRSTSRFCPAGVHMSTCLSASEIYNLNTKSPIGTSTAGFVPSSPGDPPTPLSGSSSISNHFSWGPPNLPVPSANPTHSFHNLHLIRSQSTTIPSDSRSDSKPNDKVNFTSPINSINPVLSLADSVLTLKDLSPKDHGVLKPANDDLDEKLNRNESKDEFDRSEKKLKLDKTEDNRLTKDEISSNGLDEFQPGIHTIKVCVGFFCLFVVKTYLILFASF